MLPNLFNLALEIRKTVGDLDPSCFTGGGGGEGGRPGRNVKRQRKMRPRNKIGEDGWDRKLIPHDALCTVHCSDHLPELWVWDFFKRVFRKWQLKYRQHVGFPSE